jgi:hypothetical protein
LRRFIQAPKEFDCLQNQPLYARAENGVHIHPEEASQGDASPSVLTAGVNVKRTSEEGKYGFFKRHGLSLVAGAILLLWVILYSAGKGQGHWNSFFGNAIADCQRSSGSGAGD